MGSLGSQPNCWLTGPVAAVLGVLRSVAACGAGGSETGPPSTAPSPPAGSPDAVTTLFSACSTHAQRWQAVPVDGMAAAATGSGRPRCCSTTAATACAGLSRWPILERLVLMTEHWLTASPELKVLIGDVDRAADLYAAGWTLRRIAGELNVDRSTVRLRHKPGRVALPDARGRQSSGLASFTSARAALEASRRLEGIAYSASGRLSEVFEFAERAFSTKLS
jgi:hypothetical protein